MCGRGEKEVLCVRIGCAAVRLVEEVRNRVGQASHFTEQQAEQLRSVQARQAGGSPLAAAHVISAIGCRFKDNDDARVAENMIST